MVVLFVCFGSHSEQEVEKPLQLLHCHRLSAPFLLDGPDAYNDSNKSE